MQTLIANHLWQSTLFALACAALTRGLRNNRAQARHWIWIAASVKFLVPFAALMALGRELGWRLLPPVAARQLTVVMQFVGEPFTPTGLPASARASAALPITTGPDFAAMVPALFILWIAGVAGLLTIWLVRWLRVSRGVRVGALPADGRELTILRRLEREHDVRRPVVLVLSDGPTEPGVFGILKPRLVWPRGITDRLDDRQMEAIIAHELSHVRRHDNLVALLHMVVQAVVWFHPLVWWIGARLVDERERACDEDVIRLGSEPEVYAESILKTCQFFIESPLACVAGVTGADLKQRIEAIMVTHGADALSASKRLVLAIAAFFAIAGPITIGVLNAPRLRAQTAPIVQADANPTFEVASIKPNKSTDGRVALMLQPGGRITATNVPLSMLIRFSYQLQDFQVVGGPDWMNSDRFDILAKAADDIPPMAPGTTGPGQLMMRSLLADRFKLTTHVEKREMPMYALVLARSDGRLGAALHRSTVDCKALMERLRGAVPPTGPGPGERPPCGFRIGPGRMTGGGFPVSQLAASLSGFVQRIVVDRTGLTGDFDLNLTFSPDQMTLGPLKPGVPGPPPASTDSDSASLSTSLQEQLGLKLESTRGPVDVMVMDHVEAPTPD